VHTAPPLPSLTHCAQEVDQPSPLTPDQFNESSRKAGHVIDSGIPTCCKTSDGRFWVANTEEEVAPGVVIASRTTLAIAQAITGFFSTEQ